MKPAKFFIFFYFAILFVLNFFLFVEIWPAVAIDATSLCNVAKKDSIENEKTVTAIKGLKNNAEKEKIVTTIKTLNNKEKGVVLSLNCSIPSMPIIYLKSVFLPGISLYKDQAFLLIVAFVGAMGAMIHGIRSVTTHTAKRTYDNHYFIWYLARPFIGAILGVIVFIILRAGLLQGQSDSLNIYGVTAITGLVGLFSEQAMQKLKSIADVIFGEAEEFDDSQHVIKDELERKTNVETPKTGKSTGSGASNVTMTKSKEVAKDFGKKK